MKSFTHSIDTLKISWQILLEPFEVEPNSAEEVFLDLVKAYSSGDRYYHTLAHIQHVLETLAQMRSLAKNRAAIQLAAWFHDVVYDPKATENEEKSAEYTEVTLNLLNIPPATISQVTQLILCTKNHQASPADIDSQILLDADLAILGSAEAQYQAYAKAIRQEYAWVSDAEYRFGRKQVLEGFLQRERIYLTPQLFTILEEKARHNLQAEVTALSW